MSESVSESRLYIAPLVSSFLITLILFFIDEGYYNFNWMKDWGNWVVFFIYVSILFIAQGIMIVMLRKVFVAEKAFYAQLFLGIFFGIAMLYWLFV